MTPDEQASFDKACELNNCAGVLLKHNLKFEASRYLNAAAIYAVSKEAKAELLWRAALLRWELKIPIVVH
jgi:hypothetical protein